MERDLDKEILETLVNAIKSKDDFKVKYDTDNKNYKYETSLNSPSYEIIINVKFTITERWFSKDKLDIKIKAFFKNHSYSYKNKKYEFNEGVGFDSEIFEIYNLLKDKYSADKLAKEKERDLNILDSLDKIVDKKFKRESTIDDILEDV